MGLHPSKTSTEMDQETFPLQPHTCTRPKGLQDTPEYTGNRPTSAHVSLPCFLRPKGPATQLGKRHFAFSPALLQPVTPHPLLVNNTVRAFRPKGL